MPRSPRISASATGMPLTPTSSRSLDRVGLGGWIHELPDGLLDGGRWSGAPACRVVSGSGWRSPALFSPISRFWCWTSRPSISTSQPRML